MNDQTLLSSPAELSGIVNRDRLLPSQPWQRKFFVGDDDAFLASLEALLHGVLPAKSVEEKWPNLVLPPGISYASLGSDLGRLYFYQLLIRLGRYSYVLELGTFVGVSTLFIAEALGERGRVTSIEKSSTFQACALENIRRAGLNAILLKTDALGYIKSVAHMGVQYDMILMDANKPHYDEMIEPAIACLSPGGLLLVDDVLMQGDALNDEPKTVHGIGVKAMLAKAAEIDGVSKVILPIGDGLLLIHKPDAK